MKFNLSRITLLHVVYVVLADSLVEMLGTNSEMLVFAVTWCCLLLNAIIMDNLVLQLSGESNPSLSPSSGSLYPLIPLLSTPAMVAPDCIDDSPSYSSNATADHEVSSASPPVASLSSVLVG